MFLSLCVDLCLTARIDLRMSSTLAVAIAVVRCSGSAWAERTATSRGGATLTTAEELRRRRRVGPLVDQRFVCLFGYLFRFDVPSKQKMAAKAMTKLRLLRMRCRSVGCHSTAGSFSRCDRHRLNGVVPSWILSLLLLQLRRLLSLSAKWWSHSRR